MTLAYTSRRMGATPPILTKIITGDHGPSDCRSAPDHYAGAQHRILEPAFGFYQEWISIDLGTETKGKGIHHRTHAQERTKVFLVEKSAAAPTGGDFISCVNTVRQPDVKRDAHATDQLSALLLE
jgi:hypothetical protein